jgi:hypothetical protein
MMGKRRLQATEPPIALLRPPTVRPQMLHPSDPELHRTDAVRDGRGAPVTCASCGCRLVASGEAWFHFSPLGGRDARGCRIACADAAHDPTGHPLA